MKATVPGTVHTDLLANKVVEDPFYRLNEKAEQWIDKEDWEYRTTFKIPDWVLTYKNVILGFEGLDTYATVILNGTQIIKADNMFIAWKT